jgi:pyrroline-5-carboxylate reductase
MGSALLRGWTTLPDFIECFEKIWVIAPHYQSVEPFLPNSRIEWLASPDDLRESPDIIVFALKPFILEEILPSYAPYQSLMVSVASGKPLSFYEALLPSATAIIRAMPNTPVSVHQGVIGLFTHRELTSAHHRVLKTCFLGLGFCLWVSSDDQLNRLTAISGSGPAYVFALMEALAKSAESLGFHQETADMLSLQTFLGASAYAFQSQDSPAQLRDQVTSPQGTTARALKVFEDNGLNTIIQTAIQAAYERAKELAQ